MFKKVAAILSLVVVGVGAHPYALECGGDLHSRLEAGTCGGPITHPKPCQIMGMNVKFVDFNNSGIRITNKTGDYFTKVVDIHFEADPGILFALEGQDGVSMEPLKPHVPSGSLNWPLVKKQGKNCGVKRKKKKGLFSGGDQVTTNTTVAPAEVAQYRISAKSGNWNEGTIVIGLAKGGPPVSITEFAYVGQGSIKSPDNGVCYSDRNTGQTSTCCQRSPDKHCQIKNKPLTPAQSAPCKNTACHWNIDPDHPPGYWSCDDQKPASQCYPPITNPGNTAAMA